MNNDMMSRRNFFQRAVAVGTGLACLAVPSGGFREAHAAGAGVAEKTTSRPLEQALPKEALQICTRDGDGKQESSLVKAESLFKGKKWVIIVPTMDGCPRANDHQASLTALFNATNSSSVGFIGVYNCSYEHAAGFQSNQKVPYRYVCDPKLKFLNTFKLRPTASKNPKEAQSPFRSNSPFLISVAPDGKMSVEIPPDSIIKNANKPLAQGSVPVTPDAFKWIVGKIGGSTAEGFKNTFVEGDNVGCEMTRSIHLH